MPVKLTTTIKKISSVPDHTNSIIIQEFSEYMKKNGSSEHHQNNNLKAVIAFVRFLGSQPTFLDIQRKEQITAFLDTKNVFISVSIWELRFSSFSCQNSYLSDEQMDFKFGQPSLLKYLHDTGKAYSNILKSYLLILVMNHVSTSA
jgi:hypothetical protein